MQVLGELTRIEKDLKRLPLPWYHRAPLGLENNTTVLQKDKKSFAMISMPAPLSVFSKRLFVVLGR